ncbi:class I SAM-dependent methyltransferase [Labilibaculum euxinus]|uniref:Methyltransferase domain-containing protein n=1 Tax=Labilibaculum euxinus TaxID=2686357 RepID=A0A7M4D5Z3_9BACT|nr:class I SAM-dependent methyltransferase [Labilibaculum euxinus]MUP38072.1 methyltransferase domain-containing protein [Labilibaculum euxinus]MVB07277.1 methyltransferase domain-containing protein [Labilibaculum euxinus]
MKEMWDQRYAESKYIYGEKANLFFVTQLHLLKSGRLLLPGEGEGRNAAYASCAGWKVDAFDYSKKAVENAKRFFAEQKVDVNIYTESILDHPSIEEKYDVAALLYLHLPSQKRFIAHRFVADSVKPGGVVLMEVFSKNQIGRKSGGPSNEDMLYDLSEIRRDFEEFDILLLEEVETHLSEGKLHDGKAMVVRFVGKKRTSGYLD